MPTTASALLTSCATSSTSSELATKTSPPTAPSAGPDQARKAIGSIYFAGIQLSSLDAEIGSLAEMLEHEDPKVVAQATADLEELLAAQEEGRGMLVDRCDRALAIADVLIGQASARRAMAKRLTALAQADEARIEKLQSLAISMVTLAHPGQKRVSLPLHDLASRKSEAVVIDVDPDSKTFVDPEKLPAELRRVKYEPDKTAIKTFLKAGGTFKGLSLEQRTSWSVANS